LLLAFDVVVVPARQGVLGDAKEGGGVGDVGETDELGRLSEEPLGGMSARGKGAIAGGEEGIATLAVELRGTEDKVDRLFAQGQVLDRTGVVAAVDAVRCMTAARADTDLLAGHDGEADWIAGGVAVLTDDAELWQVECLGPESQPFLLAHRCLFSLCYLASS